MTDAADLGVLDAAAALRARTLSAVELLEACQVRIAERNGGEPTFDGAPDAINAWVRLYPEVALAAACAADERLAREGDAAPLLCGIPVAVKDLYGIAGLPLTASSRVLEGNVAAENAVAWRRLAAEGMVPVGHTHTHEFAAGGTTDQVGNPWAVDRTAGGSSGGSAAALAARMVPAALGTDTAGSLRIPAALSGVSSIKATHGAVPIDGIVPLAASLDHAGPMGRSVADCAAVLSAMARGGAQPTALMPPPTPLGELPTAPRAGSRPLEGARVAVTDRVDAEGTDVEADVAEGVETARRALEELGATVVALPGAGDPAMEDFSVVMFSDVTAHHRPYAGHEDRYRTSIREFVELAREFTSAPAYIEAQAARGRATARWEGWFAEHRIDVLLEPTVPMTAKPRGDGYDSGHLGGAPDPLIAFTAAWNFTGLPVATLPAALGAQSNLPVGISLVAPRGREAALTQIAIDLQEHALAAPSL